MCLSLHQYFQLERFHVHSYFSPVTRHHSANPLYAPLLFIIIPFFSFFHFPKKKVRYYSGHDSPNLTFKLYTRSYHTFGDISLPLMTSDASRSIFFASLAGWAAQHI